MTPHMTTLDIVELDAEDPAAVDAAYRLSNICPVAELPPNCRYEHDVRLRLPHPAEERHLFLGYRGEEPVAMAQLDLPVLDNLDKAHIELMVPPELRRQGLGRALYGHAAGFAAERGRTSAMGFGVLDAGLDGFARAMGLRNGLVDARRRLVVAALDHDAVDGLLRDGRERARGYSVVQWRDQPPAELLSDLAALDSSFLSESPMGELDYEPEQVDAERLRRVCEVREAHGKRAYETVLVHDATGTVVAWSALRVSRTIDWHAWQMITLVHPAHRGRRLGIVAKIENLRLLLAHEPSVRAIDTFNAEVNAHMIAINEAIGFRFRENWGNWQGHIG